MFNKKFKFLSLTLLMVLSVLVLAACGDTDDREIDTGDNDGSRLESVDGGGDEVAAGWYGAIENFEVGTPFRFKGDEPLDMSMIFRELPENPFNSEWEMFQLLQEITNVKLNVEHVMHDDFEDRRNLLLATGQAPELMPFIWSGHETQFIAGGQLLPIGQYFDYLPNFTHWVTEWDMWPIIENLQRADGNIYILPGLFQDPRVRFTVALRQDILEQLDIYSELEHGYPDTWEEIRLVLEEVRDRQDEFGLDHVYYDMWNLDSTLNIAASTWGTGAGWGLGSTLHFNHDTGVFEQFAQMDASRDFVEFWSGLVADGLLNPESITSDAASPWEEFVNGRSFMIGAPGHVLEFEQDLNNLIAEGHSELEGVQFRALPIPHGPLAPMTGEQVIDNGIVLNNSIRERDDFIAILQFVDWLWFSEEGREFAIWGVEGTHFEWVDGYRQLVDGLFDTRNSLNLERQDDEGARDMQNDLGFGENVWVIAAGSSRDLMTSTMRDDIRELHELNAQTRERNRLNPSVPWASLGAMRQEMYALWQTSIADHTRAQMAAFIVGHRSMDEWDDFLAELEAMNLNEWVAAANEAHELGPMIPDED